MPREQQAPTTGRRAWPERAPTDGRGRVSAQDAVVMPRCGECESIRVCSDAQKVAGGRRAKLCRPEMVCATADAGGLRQGPLLRGLSLDQRGLQDRKPPP